MKIKDIMITDIKTVSLDMNAKEALELLFKYKMSGLPVVDKDFRLIGMFTEESVLFKLFPSYTKEVGSFIYEDKSQLIQKRVTQLGEYRVSDIMLKDIVTVSEDSPIFELVRLMLTKYIRRIPVVDKDNKIIGIVSRGDILKSLIK